MHTYVRPLRTLCALLVTALMAPDAVRAFTGDLTFYGGAGANGACSSNFRYSGFKTVAMNAPQYGGKICGACVQACYKKGSQKICFKAIVDNECPECRYASLDVGEWGDGRWPVTWNFINCPPHAPIIRSQGSNPWYGKIKVEGVGRVHGVNCGGKAWAVTHDGYWTGGPSGGKLLNCGINCVINAEQGRVFKRSLPGSLFGGGCQG